MKTLATAGILALLAAPAGAQDAPPQQSDPTDMLVRIISRGLELSEEQAEKVREIFKKQTDELRSILNDEQKERFDSMSSMMSGRGGRGGPGGGMMRGGRGPSTDELKEQLGLTDEQAEKINAIRDTAREENREKMRELFQSRPSREEMTEFFQKMREETNAKIREVLTDEQKTKYDELLKAREAEREQAPDRSRGRFDRSPEARANRVMEELKIENKEEAEAIKGLVVNVIELQQKLETYNRETRGQIEELRRDTDLSDEAVGKKLEELLKGRDAIEKEIEAARKELSEVVTYRQELELIRARIL